MFKYSIMIIMVAIFIVINTTLQHRSKQTRTNLFDHLKSGQKDLALFLSLII